LAYSQNIERESDPQTLIRRCNRGDEQAWEEFYNRYSGMIYRVVKKQGSLRPQEVEEIAQDVFVSLFKALKNYDPARSVEAYILEIARRVRISRYRKTTALKRGGGNPRELSLEVHGSPREDGGSVSVASNDDDQETSLIKAQERQILRNALREVSETCRKLLSLRYELGLSYKEIAREMEAKEATLRVRVQRCLSALEGVYSELIPQEAGNR
jgi:RNA polymerase sigma-70 factor, ECF subfamily